MIPIGVDLGTTHLAAAWMDANGEPRLVFASDGSALLPATIYFETPDVVQVGRDPLKSDDVEMDRLAIQTKRWLGRPRNFAFHDREYSAVELASLMLRKLLTQAEERLGDKVGPVTIAIPAHFDVAQRAAVHQVVALAGVELHTIVSEPVAASLAFGPYRKNLPAATPNGTPTLVIDMGGGTLDLSVLTCHPDLIDVQVVAGDAHLGGMDFDRAIYYRICHHIMDQAGLDPAANSRLRYRLLSLSRWAKESLTFNESVTIEIPAEHLDGKTCPPLAITATEAGDLWEELLTRSEALLMRVLSECEVESINIERVVFSGGGSLVPAFRKRMINHLAPLAAETDFLMGPDEAVAIGAALYGQIHSNNTAIKAPLPKLHEQLPYDLGVADDVGHMVVVIAKGTSLPGRGVHVFTTVEDQQEQVIFRIVRRDPDGRVTPLGEVCLDQLPQVPQGEPDLNMHFQVDAQGALSVDAWEGEKTPVTLKVAFSGDLTALRPARRGKQLKVL